METFQKPQEAQSGPSLKQTHLRFRLLATWTSRVRYSLQRLWVWTSLSRQRTPRITLWQVVLRVTSTSLGAWTRGTLCLPRVPFLSMLKLRNPLNFRSSSPQSLLASLKRRRLLERVSPFTTHSSPPAVSLSLGTNLQKKRESRRFSIYGSKLVVTSGNKSSCLASQSLTKRISK